MSGYSGRLGLRPEWVEDLLGIWAAADLKSGGPPGFPTLSRAFQGGGEDEEDGGYSSLELVAIGLAVERLQREHLDEWYALVATFKPWARRSIPIQPPGSGWSLSADPPPGLVQVAAERLSGWVDEAVGDA